MDLDWENIRRGMAWARAHAGDENGARLCLAYTSWRALLDVRLRAPEQHAWLSVRLDAARSLGDREAEADALRQLASVRPELDPLDEALRCCEASPRLPRETRDR
jgi:hypothetical protein